MDLKNKITFFLNKNKNIKKIIKIPVIYFRSVKSYPKVKKMFARVCSDINTIEKENIIWYFCAPEHNNLGDLAQRMCIENWCKENYSNFRVIEIPSAVVNRFNKKMLDLMKKYLKEEHVIIFQSGYTMTDGHPDDKVRLTILNEFYKNRVLIFPQTILYENNNNMLSMYETLKKCERLLLLTRDQLSYDYASQNFKGINIELFPDIVTTLIGKKVYSQERNGIALCVRNDGEKYYSYGEISALENDLRKISSVNVTDTNDRELIDINSNSIQTAVWKKIDTFANYKLMITDRYHGTIFSLMSNTPVIVMKTKDHKVSTGVKWFKNIYDDYAFYCDDIKNISNLASNIISSQNNTEIKPYFKREYYDKLKSIFEKI